LISSPKTYSEYFMLCLYQHNQYRFIMPEAYLLLTIFFPYLTIFIDLNYKYAVRSNSFILIFVK
jgi:hypothetical protein